MTTEYYVTKTALLECRCGCEDGILKAFRLLSPDGETLAVNRENLRKVLQPYSRNTPWLAPWIVIGNLIFLARTGWKNSRAAWYPRKGVRLSKHREEYINEILRPLQQAVETLAMKYGTVQYA